MKGGGPRARCPCIERRCLTKPNIETIIVGAGQAGLATSYWLAQRGCEHVVLEQAAKAGNVWRSDRWDSFALVTPNWAICLPGAEYRGDAPEGAMSGDEVAAYIEGYAESYRLPIHYGARVTSVEPNLGGYLVRVGEEVSHASNVVIATGFFQRPKMPPFGAQLSTRITQLHSGQYRNPEALPPGAVLVVGSAQSGSEIAGELVQSGHRVYLCVGSAARAPRRYRGRDSFEWMNLSGFWDRTPDMLPSPQARFAGAPPVSGRDGGYNLSLHQFARAGIVLLGHLDGARDNTIWLAPDLKQNLARADKSEAELVKMIDGFIEKSGLDAPPETLPELRDAYAAEELAELDLKAAGVTTVIWAMGYAFDFSLVKLPVTDGYGYPIQSRGVTGYPGLYFVGLPWLHTLKSGLLFGVGEDAGFIADTIARKRPQPQLQPAYDL